MAKTKTTFYCQNCGAQYAKWQGQCSSCKQWNTIAEEVIQKEDKKDWKTPNQATKKRVPKPTLVNEIQYEQEARYNTNNQELNRVLGGGLVAKLSGMVGSTLFFRYFPNSHTPAAAPSRSK